WVVRMGEMRLLLGLSGWTANDWTGASALDQIAPPVDPSDDLLGDIAAAFKDSPSRTFEQICRQTSGAAPFVAAGLNRLALLGQLIHDLAGRVYRWRQIMPVTLSLDQLGPDNPETEAGHKLAVEHQVTITRDERTALDLRVLSGRVPDRQVDLVLDGDGRMFR